MTDRFFRYLDIEASATRPAYLTDRNGPVFWNVPAPAKLAARFGLKPAKAFKVFTAWRTARGWVHPNDDPKWLARVA